jgi:SRSO17 transposase
MDTKTLKTTLKDLEYAFEGLIDQLKEFFPNSSTRTSARYYLRGLLSAVDHKNSWQLAQEEGFETPYRFQHLLGRALWDADAVRDFHQAWVAQTLGISEGILILDDTGFLKKGKHSAGVARQYSGTAGRIDNCQIGVFLGWATDEGHTLIDRELYLPQEWTNDEPRCKLAHIPQGRPFYTKLELGQQMLERAFNRGFKATWVVADAAYGASYPLRKFLEDHHQPYVVAVPKTQSICRGWHKMPAQEVLSLLKPDHWKKISCGYGSKGLRLYEWALMELNCPVPSYSRWILMRRSLSSQDLSFYLVFAPASASLEEIVKAAGHRWKIEESFESAKGEVGLDHYEVRSFTGWYRHMTFALLALSLLRLTQSQLFPANDSSSMEAFKKKRRVLSR